MANALDLSDLEAAELHEDEAEAVSSSAARRAQPGRHQSAGDTPPGHDALAEESPPVDNDGADCLDHAQPDDAASYGIADLDLSDLGKAEEDDALHPPLVCADSAGVCSDDQEQPSSPRAPRATHLGGASEAASKTVNCALEGGEAGPDSNAAPLLAPSKALGESRSPHVERADAIAQGADVATCRPASRAANSLGAPSAAQQAQRADQAPDLGDEALALNQPTECLRAAAAGPCDGDQEKCGTSASASALMDSRPPSPIVENGAVVRLAGSEVTPPIDAHSIAEVESTTPQAAASPTHQRSTAAAVDSATFEQPQAHLIGDGSEPTSLHDGNALAANSTATLFTDATEVCASPKSMAVARSLLARDYV